MLTPKYKGIANLELRFHCLFLLSHIWALFKLAGKITEAKLHYLLHYLLLQPLVTHSVMGWSQASFAGITVFSSSSSPFPNRDSKCLCLPIAGSCTCCNKLSLLRVYPQNQAAFSFPLPNPTSSLNHTLPKTFPARIVEEFLMQSWPTDHCQKHLISSC